MLHAALQAPFAKSIGRYPAPVWTLAVWLCLSTFNIGIRIVVMQAPGAIAVLRAVLMAVVVVTLAVVLVLGARTPEWFLAIQPFLAVGYLSALTYAAPTVLAVATTSWGLIAATVYASLWFGRRYVAWLMACLTVVYLAALLARGERGEAFAMWAVVTVICIAVGFLLQYLIESLRTDSVIDPLTGLLNRRGMQVAIAMGDASGRIVDPRSLIVIDLDGFKGINDEFGHAAGDRLLRDFGALLRDTMRADDLAIRSGGDEFMLILPQTDREGAERLVRRLAAACPLTMSYGIAEWNSRTDFDVASRQADQQMYGQKERRRQSGS